MKICLCILALLIVSAFAAKLKPKPLEFEKNKRYLYEYIGSVVTGIPSSSNPGTRLKANVEISHIVRENGVALNVMRLTNISFTEVFDESTNSDDLQFGNFDYGNSVKRKLLELTFQYHVNAVTKAFSWIEVDKLDEPWSINIKKAIIEMFLVDIAGKQLKINPVHEYDQTQNSRDEIQHAFNVFEPTSKGECETMYQVINDLPESVSGLPGSEQFYWKVLKTRNYQNCIKVPESAHHNWARKDCGECCEQAPTLSEIKMNNYYSAEKSQCSCDTQAESLDQQSTSIYAIECLANPYILSAESISKIVFHDHGIRLISYTNQNLLFKEIYSDIIDPLNSKHAIRVENLTFSLYPYLDSVTQPFSYDSPVSSLLIPSDSQSLLVHSTVELLNQVANAVMDDEDKNQQKIAGLMQKVISQLANLGPDYIMKIFTDSCVVPENELYTNTLESVRRQLFLDAISHVGTRNVSIWFEHVLDGNANLLYSIEVRQVIENLPLNVYTPTTSFLKLLQKKMNIYFQQEDWDLFSAFALAYGKLIAKACPNTESHPEFDNEINMDKSRVRSNDWWIPEEEKCTPQQTIRYIKALSGKLMETKSIRGRVSIARALALTGKTYALKNLASYAKGECGCSVHGISDCTLFRTAVIYSLQHMISFYAKQIRSLVLPICNNKTESYELRLAAFTVFIYTRPKIHEIYSVAVTLRNEPDNKVITMVRSILEETVTFTHACHQPITQTDREMIATLFEVNLDDIVSQVSYNKCYSTDKSTGFFDNDWFVLKNISNIPEYGFFSFDRHWKSSTNPRFTVAFQHKGLETILKNLLNAVFTSGTIDELWMNNGVNSRDEYEFILKLFMKFYGETSLITIEKHSLLTFFKQFKHIMTKFVKGSKFDYKYVRFNSHSTYIDVVPSAIGLPSLATKQIRQIISFRLTKSELTSGRLSFKVDPKILFSTHSSLSVFNLGLEAKTNTGVHNDEIFSFHVPFNFNFGWNLKDKLINCSMTPVSDRTDNWLFEIYNEKDKSNYLMNLTYVQNGDFVKKKASKKKRGIVLFTGLASNMLFHKGDSPRGVTSCFDSPQLWYNTASAGTVNDCWAYTIALSRDSEKNTVYDSQSTVFVNLTGAADTVKDLGAKLLGHRPESTIIYEKMIDFFNSKDYKNIYGVPMDWRRATVDIEDSYYAKIKEIVENAYKETGKPSILVCHSYGCANLVKFVEKSNNQWLNERVYSIFTLGAPWGGSMKAVKALLSGDDLGVMVNVAPFLHDVQKTFTSFVHLMPSYTLTARRQIEGKPFVTIAGIPGQPTQHFYIPRQILEKFGFDHNITLGRENIENILDVFDSLTHTDGTHRIQINCFWTKKFDTLSHLHYSFKHGHLMVDEDTNEKGDGTVSESSLSLCNLKNYINSRWTSSAHQAMLYDKEIFEEILKDAETNRWG